MAFYAVAAGAVAVGGFVAWMRNYTMFDGPERGEGKVYLVTGANSGTGYELTKQLNLRGGKVYMLCRNKRRASDAKNKLIQEGCAEDRLLVMILDLSDFESVRKFVNNFGKKNEKVDVLVCNAGVMDLPEFSLTRDGNEMTFQSNYLSHLLLTILLLPKLRESRDPRVIFVASSAHKYGNYESIEHCNSPAQFRGDGMGLERAGNYAYARSKQAMIMAAEELQRRLSTKEENKIRVFSCHPGIVKTEIMQHSKSAHCIRTRSQSMNATKALFGLISCSPLEGCQTMLLLALSSSELKAGQYYANCALKGYNSNCANETLRAKLVDDSLERIGATLD